MCVRGGGRGVRPLLMLGKIVEIKEGLKAGKVSNLHPPTLAQRSGSAPDSDLAKSGHEIATLPC